MQHAWSPAPARENRKGGADLRAGDRGRDADGLFSLAAGPVGWVPPGSLSRRVSQPGGLYIPRQQTVTFHSEGCRFRRSARRRQHCAGPPDARGRERPRSKFAPCWRRCVPVSPGRRARHHDPKPKEDLLGRSGCEDQLATWCDSDRATARVSSDISPDAGPLLKADRSASTDSRKNWTHAWLAGPCS